MYQKSTTVFIGVILLITSAAAFTNDSVTRYAARLLYGGPSIPVSSTSSPPTVQSPSTGRPIVKGGPATTPAPAPALVPTLSPVSTPKPSVAACTFNGSTIQSGASVTAYESSSVAYGSVCASQVRACTDGALSGTYRYASCSVGARASCTFHGSTVQSGSSVTAYQSSSVSYGSTCVSQTRTCDDGSLSGSYQYASCSVAEGQWRAGIASLPSNASMNGIACVVSNASIQGNGAAGLSYASGGAYQVAGKSVTSCLDVDFGSGGNTALRVDYLMPNSACGVSCSGQYCGTDPGSEVFVSGDGSTWTSIGTLPFSTSARTEILAASMQFRYAKVCRGGGGGSRSQLAIDYVATEGAQTTVPTDPLPYLGDGLVYAMGYDDNYLELGRIDFSPDGTFTARRFLFDPTTDPHGLDAGSIQHQFDLQCDPGATAGTVKIPAYKKTESFSGAYTYDNATLRLYTKDAHGVPTVFDWSRASAAAKFFSLGTSVAQTFGYGYISDMPLRADPSYLESDFRQGINYYGALRQKYTYATPSTPWPTAITTSMNIPIVAAGKFPISGNAGLYGITNIDTALSMHTFYTTLTNPPALFATYGGDVWAQEYGHDYNRNNCFDEEDHTKLLWSAEDAGGIVRGVVWIEQSWELDDFPTISVGYMGYH